MAKRLPVTISKKIRKHRYILEKLAQSKSRDRKKMLLNSPDQLFSVLKELCKLVVAGKLQLGKAMRHQKTVEKISKTPVKNIKATVKQQGGIFGSIIAGVLPFLAPLIKGLFK